jgi:N-acetylglucosamine kinase-like BadF-type ATPase
MRRRLYYLGLDGGGTKTAGALVDTAGMVVAECHGGASMVSGAPKAEVCDNMRCLVERLCGSAGVRLHDVAGFGIGLNGVDFPDEIPMQHAALAGALAIPPDKLTLVNDGIAALWGATTAPAAVILQHGTGFTAAWRTAYGNEALFDHLGVGRCFNLRGEALALVARMIDGWAEPTALKDAFLECLGNPPEATFSEQVFRGRISPAQMVRLLQVVYDLGERGDPAAAMLVDRAIADYAGAVGAMVRKTGHADPDVVFGGGRFRSAPAGFMRRLSAAVLRDWPGARIRRPIHQPAVGAAVMAAFAGGHSPESFFRKEEA